MARYKTWSKMIMWRRIFATVPMSRRKAVDELWKLRRGGWANAVLYRIEQSVILKVLIPSWTCGGNWLTKPTCHRGYQAYKNYSAMIKSVTSLWCRWKLFYVLELRVESHDSARRNGLQSSLRIVLQTAIIFVFRWCGCGANRLQGDLFQNANKLISAYHMKTWKC